MIEYLKLNIFRFDPAVDEAPRYRNYKVVEKDNLTVIRALFKLAADDPDPPAFRRYMCNRGQCSSCLMTINGRSARACTTLVKDGMIIEPLRDHPVIRDLVVDFGTRVGDTQGGFHLIRTGSRVLDSKSRRRRGLIGPWVRMTVDRKKCAQCPESSPARPCLTACWVNRIEILENRYGKRLEPFSGPIKLRNGAAELSGVCNICHTQPCVAACPVQAFSNTARGAGIRIAPDRCIGCGMCIFACAAGNILMNIERGHAVKCDLCGGDPKCVKACPLEAISFKLVGGPEDSE